MSILNSRTEAQASACGTGVAAMPVYKAGPRKTPPLHPGGIIADILDENNLSPRQAAIAIGMTPAGLGKVINGKSPVTIETALRIGKLFGNGPDLWLNLQREYDLYHARKVLADDIAKIKTIKG